MTPVERQKEMNRQRAMAGEPGHASIGPPQSGASHILDQIRYGIPRRVERFLEPETPEEMGGLLAASITEPAGTAIDLADFAIGFRERDLPRMGWATAGAALPFVGAAGIKGLLRRRGAKAADEGVIFREADADIGAEGMEGLNRPGRAYRGMEATEYDATVGSGGGATSRQDYSIADEGTSYADDIRDAESYVNFGRSDPRITGRPSYIVEVDATDLTRSPDGYLKASGEVPPERIERVWKITDEDGALVGREVARTADELPMDEASRVARAGSRYPSTGYHGTTADISEFSGPTWITDDPRVASHYADRARAGDILEEGIEAGEEFVGGVDELDPYMAMEGAVREGGQNVMPLRYGAGDVLDMTELGDSPDPEDLLAWLRDRKIIEFEHADIDDWLNDLTVDDPALWKMIEDWGLEVDIKNAGFGGLRIEDIVASNQRGAMGTIGHTSTLVFDPKNIRSSTAAAFDPAQVESASLVAGGAGLLGAGVARGQRERE